MTGIGGAVLPGGGTPDGVDRVWERVAEALGPGRLVEVRWQVGGVLPLPQAEGRPLAEILVALGRQLGVSQEWIDRMVRGAQAVGWGDVS